MVSAVRDEEDAKRTSIKENCLTKGFLFDFVNGSQTLTRHFPNEKFIESTTVFRKAFRGIERNHNCCVYLNRKTKENGMCIIQFYVT